jgi:hypothetical protein
MSACAKGGCKTVVHPETHYHTCSLCLEPKYCSDECRVIDWPIHDCPNVQRVNGAIKPMLEPYHYEDLLTAAELDELEINHPIFQSKAYLFANDNGTMAYYQTEPVEGNAVSENGRMPQMRGAKPNTDLMARNYILRLVLNDAPHLEFHGQIPTDLIYKDNTSNDKARALAGYGDTFKEKLQGLRRRLYAKEASYIFWPNMKHQDNKNTIASTMILAGDVLVELWIEDKLTKEFVKHAHLNAGYELQPKADNFWKNAGRALKKAFSQQMQLKFPAEDVKQMQVLSYADSQGNGVVLTFSVDGSRAILKDIEFMTSTTLVPIASGELVASSFVGEHITERFICDTRNINDVIGLAIALDTHLALRPLESAAAHKQMETYAGIIKNHAYALEQQEPAASNPSPQLHVAISAAMDMLASSPTIGSSVAYWRKKADGTPESFGPLLDAIIGKLTALREKSSGIVASGKGGIVNKVKRGALSLQKGVIQKDLANIVQALSAKIASMDPGDKNYEKWKAFSEKAARAKSNNTLTSE